MADFASPNSQIQFSQQQAATQDQITREKKLFTDNLESIASGKVNWPELRAQHFDAPSSQPLSPADQSYQSQQDALQAILDDLRATTSQFNTPDPNTAA